MSLNLHIPHASLQIPDYSNYLLSREAVDAEGGRAWLLASSWAPSEAQMGAAASLPSALAMPPSSNAKW
jgi:hypothetical protein